MNYNEFKNKIANSPIIRSADISILDQNKQLILNQLGRWQNKGLIVKLKKGIYLLNENDRKIFPSMFFLANQLYSPSYISLETALNYYDLIPEAVADTTSITTKKTTTFKNKLGVFVYQHLKPQSFQGFNLVKDNNGLNYFMAFPEKAVVDFFYLNMNRFKNYDKDIFSTSFRFQNTENLDVKKIKKFAGLFNNKKLKKISNLFCNFIQEEKNK